MRPADRHPLPAPRCFAALVRSAHAGGWHLRSRVCCRVLQWVKDFAEQRGLKWRQDDVGNLVVLRPGSGGGEAAPPVVIQVLGALPSAQPLLAGRGGLGGGLGAPGVPVAFVALHAPQGHLDMVTEKNSDVQHDFFTDALTLRRSQDGAWLMVRRPHPDSRAAQEGHLSHWQHPIRLSVQRNAAE